MFEGIGRAARRVALAAVLGAFATAGQLQAMPTAPVAARQPIQQVAQGHCQSGYDESALVRAGATPLCPAGFHPDTYLELTALQDQLKAREFAPFTTAAPGALQSAVSQARTVRAAGTIAGSGFAWSPAGTTPDCDGHTTQSNICPLANNTSPTASNGDYTISSLGHKELSGRITAFAGDPANPNRVFAAPAVGGVFETTDGGATWHSIADQLPTQAMGAVTYDAPLHRIFAGTGDNSFGGSGIQGLGIFYSDDDGATWAASSGLPALSLSFRIVAAPNDASGNTVYAATSRGLFRSTNGGASFTNLNLPTSPAGYTVPDPTQGNAQVPCTGNTTAPLCFFANIVTDVVVKGTSSANAPAGAVMAVVGWRAGNQVDHNPDGTNNTSCKLGPNPTNCLQAPQNGIYIANNGTTFTFHGSSGPVAGVGFAANDVVGRTTLGIADGAGQNNDAVFALVQDAKKLQHCVEDPFVQAVNVCQADVQALGAATVLDGLYATYDFGGTWTKIMDWAQLHAGSGALLGEAGYSPGVQSWYNNWVKPDPTMKDSSGNPTRLLFGLEEIWENNQLDLTSGPGGILDTPYPLQPANAGPSAPWIDIGEYWTDCGGLNATAGVTCNSTGIPTPNAVSTTHPDQHAFLFVPDGSGGVTFYGGSDGGAYKQHVASGQDFSQNNWGDGIDVGLYTLQPYDAEIARDGTIVAGLQDNGETKIAPSGKEQHTIFGGDGFWTIIDPRNSQNIIEEYTYGVTNMSLNGGKDWYNIAAGACNSSEALFSTPFELDPTNPDHAVQGCTQVEEAGNGASTDVTGTNHTNNPIWTNPCVTPPGGDPATCQLTNSPWAAVFDLGVSSAPGQPVNRNNSCTVSNCIFNVPSAVGVRGENIYIGFCGYCDIVTGGVPFNSGIATNVAGSQPPQAGTSNGWHIAHAFCANCQTPNGLLPKRYINSIQLDPSDPNTVYVTMGGYSRRWIPPGSLGDDVSQVGVGHVFVSHDAGEHFTDISQGLPDVSANFSLVHNGNLVVATDLGVYIASDTKGTSWTHLGTGLPNAPVFTIRLQPGNPDRMIAATYGRGVYQYSFTGVITTTGPNNGGGTVSPNTGAFLAPDSRVAGGLAFGGFTIAIAMLLPWRRKRGAA